MVCCVLLKIADGIRHTNKDCGERLSALSGQKTARSFKTVRGGVCRKICSRGVYETHASVHMHILAFREMSESKIEAMYCTVPGSCSL